MMCVCMCVCDYFIFALSLGYRSSHVKVGTRMNPFVIGMGGQSGQDVDVLGVFWQFVRKRAP